MSPNEIRLAYAALGHARPLVRFLEYAGLRDEEAVLFLQRVANAHVRLVEPEQRTLLIQWCRQQNLIAPPETLKGMLDNAEIGRRGLLKTALGIASAPSLARGAYATGIAGSIEQGVAGLTQGSPVLSPRQTLAMGVTGAVGMAGELLADYCNERFLLGTKEYLGEQNPPLDFRLPHEQTRNTLKKR